MTGVQTCALPIWEARAVREEQRKYLEIISFPGGLSRSAARASGMEAMMHRFPCFAGTDSAVRESIIKLDKQIQELERSDQEALTLDGKNDRGMKKLGSMKASNPESYVRADSKSLSVTGSDASSSSDITGYLNVRRKFSSVSEKTEKIARLISTASITQRNLDGGLGACDTL